MSQQLAELSSRFLLRNTMVRGGFSPLMAPHFEEKGNERQMIRNSSLDSTYYRYHRYVLLVISFVALEQQLLG